MVQDVVVALGRPQSERNTGLFNRHNLLLIVAAGAVAEIVLELIAWWLVPAMLGRPMRPDVLVSDLARSLFQVDIGVTLAVSLHLILGVLVFPAAFVIARAVAGFKSTVLPAIVYGLILWVLAQAVLAPLAGRPFMLGFIAYTWASLFAHLVYAVAVALTLDGLAPQRWRR